MGKGVMMHYATFNFTRNKFEYNILNRQRKSHNLKIKMQQYNYEYRDAELLN